MSLVMPAVTPVFGNVRLRAFDERDVDMLLDLATDPYVPDIGTLPAHATRQQALAYIDRQHDRLATGAGYSFCAADRVTDQAVGGAGCGWPSSLRAGPRPDMPSRRVAAAAGWPARRSPR